MANEVLSGSEPAKDIPIPPTTPVVDDDPDTVDDDDIEFLASTEDLDAPAKESAPTSTADASATPATAQPPAGATPTPAVTELPVTPASGAAPSAEPAKEAQPAAQPTPTWVPPNLFAVEAPGVPATQQAAPVQAPTAPATPPATQAPAAPTEAAAPGSIPTDATKVREQYLGELSNYYTPRNEEEVRALSLEPEKVLPQMFARAHVDILDAVVNGIAQNLPSLVQSTVNRMVGEANASRSFYKEWPDLAKTEYTPTVQRLMQAYKAQFPQAPMDQLIRDVGAAAMVGLRLPIPGMPQQTQQPSMTPPISPVNPGGGTGGPAGRSNNPFENFADEIITEERFEEL